MLICRIDIGKNNHEACLMDDTGRQISKTLRFANQNKFLGNFMSIVSHTRHHSTGFTHESIRHCIF